MLSFRLPSGMGVGRLCVSEVGMICRLMHECRLRHIKHVLYWSFGVYLELKIFRNIFLLTWRKVFINFVLSIIFLIIRFSCKRISFPGVESNNFFCYRVISVHIFFMLRTLAPIVMTVGLHFSPKTGSAPIYKFAVFRRFFVIEDSDE